MTIRGVPGEGSVPIPSSKVESNAGEQTAKKVSKLTLPAANPLSGLKGRKVTVLGQANALYKQINKLWNHLAPEELAEKIVELEKKVTLLEGGSSAIKKMRDLTEEVVFEFVFSIAREMKVSLPLEGELPSFARQIYQFAAKMQKEGTLNPFQQLSQTQQRESYRYASTSKGGEK